MQKAHANQNWENFPSINTPINEQNLNKLDRSVDEIDNRVIALDTSKFNLSDAQTLIKGFSFDYNTGTITITYYNGATATINTGLAQVAVNFDFDKATQVLYIIKADGSRQPVDLSAFITDYEFLDSDTVAFSLDSSGKVTAIVKEGSIQEKHLQPNYLADIKVEAAKSESSASASAQSAGEAEQSAKLAESHNHGGTGVRDGEDTDNSKYWSEQSKKHLDDTVQAGIDAVGGIGSAESDALGSIGDAKKEALDAINNALDDASPEFYLDKDTGLLYYQGGAFDFDLDADGYLLYGVVV